VSLDSTAAAGTTATVVLPDRLLLPLTDEDRLYSGQWLRDLDASTVPSVVPAAAVTTLPPTPVPVAALPTAELPTAALPTAALPTAAVPVASLPAASPPVAPIPHPRTPLPLESRAMETTVPPTSPELTSYTATGLPRRPQDTRLSEVDDSPPAPSTPDPEVIRARLSSLAGGIAAAENEARSMS
jgi:hypothetical protein